jgi:hypothetical protein
MLHPIGTELLLAVGPFIPFHVSVLGTLFDQLTLRQVAVTGLTILIHCLLLQYSFKVSPRALLYSILISNLRLNLGLSFSTLAHPESSYLFHKFPCKSDLTFLAGGFGFRTLRRLM